MELKLNIYEKGKTIKTYTAHDFRLSTGLCLDVLEIVDADKMLNGKKTTEQLGLEVLKIVIKSFPLFKPFLQDIFDGLTDDEFRKTDIKEVAEIIIAIVKFSIQYMSNLGGQEKN